MANIELLDKQTIDKIAAGEAIERPSSVVKELVENAIDANATAITVEIKEGGISFIRVTDNGCGIPKGEIKTAFLRHSTSKIRKVEDLDSISSLGFRGEALSSIAAVAQVELITKTPSELTGARFTMEDGIPGAIEEIGAPDGTTFIVRNLFFHTPARRKFLKTPQTEGSYINTLVEKMALSRPDISFQFIMNRQPKLHTPGNHRLKDVIYQIYGRDITANLIEIEEKNEFFEAAGFLGKPLISRGNRNYENYFVNGRYIKSSLLSKSIEDGYQLHLMQHMYPFTVLHFSFHGDGLDVNVHPTKMEMRFRDNEQVYSLLKSAVKRTLDAQEIIPSVSFGKQEKEPKAPAKAISETTEPFEEKRRENQAAVRETPPSAPLARARQYVEKDSPYSRQYIKEPVSYGQESLFAADQTGNTGTGGFLKDNQLCRIRMIGQLFDTYWLMEYDNSLYIMDQHAAHEKVLFERTMKSLSRKEHASQMLSPPLILTLSLPEQDLLTKYMDEFTTLGFEIAQFGGSEYAISAVPQNLFSLNEQALFLEMLDNLSEINGRATPQMVLEKIALMSCKAAVKGNQRLSLQEAESLVKELMTLENPYQCPHGRPTLIMVSKYELEKKFKRVL